MNIMTIYHNPNCGTSRNTLAIIRHCGIEPKIIHYLDTPPSENELRQLIQQMGINVRDLLRTNVPPYTEQKLNNTALSDDMLLAKMLEFPILINRPIVVSEKGVKLCRPSELVLDLLPVPLPSIFYKEDGEAVHPRSINQE